MENRTRVILILLAISIAYPFSACLAQTISAQLLANQSALDGEFNAMFDLSESILTTGINGVYKNDRYRYINARASIGNEIITDGLTLDLGIFGNIGRFKKTDRNATLASTGFMISAAYDLSQGISDQVPVIFHTRVSLSPEPLCYQHTDRFSEIIAEVQWQALRQAAVVARYRYVDADFERKGVEWQKVDNAGYLGLKFTF